MHHPSCRLAGSPESSWHGGQQLVPVGHLMVTVHRAENLQNRTFLNKLKFVKILLGLKERTTTGKQEAQWDEAFSFMYAKEPTMTFLVTGGKGLLASDIGCGAVHLQHGVLPLRENMPVSLVRSKGADAGTLFVSFQLQPPYNQSATPPLNYDYHYPAPYHTPNPLSAIQHPMPFVPPFIPHPKPLPPKGGKEKEKKSNNEEKPQGLLNHIPPPQVAHRIPKRSDTKDKKNAYGSSSSSSSSSSLFDDSCLE